MCGELKGSKSTKCPRWALPVNPVFEDEKSNGSDGKSVKQKIA